MTDEGFAGYDPDYWRVHFLAYRLVGSGTFLVLDRVGRHQQYLQGKAWPEKHYYYLEAREGNRDRHYFAEMGDWHRFVRAFTFYAGGREGWQQDMQWRPLQGTM